MMMLASMISSLLQRAAAVPAMVRLMLGWSLHGTHRQRAVSVRVHASSRRVR
jgi:hypothetical protein